MNSLEDIISEISAFYQKTNLTPDKYFDKLLKIDITEPKPGPLNKIFKWYSDYSDAMFWLSQIINHIANIEIQGLISVTQRDSILENQKIVQIAYKTMNIDDDQIIETLIQEIEPDLDSISLAIKLYNKNVRTVYLLKAIVQKALQSTDKITSFKILEMMEEQRQLAIQGESISVWKYKKLHLENPPLSSFDLIPATDSMLLNDLLKLILVEENKPFSGKLISVAKQLSIGFIVCYHVVMTPVEYNINKVLGINQIQDAIKNISFESGPNESMISLYNTAKFYPAGKLDYHYDIINENMEKFYIIETLDGQHFRCLTPWISANKFGLKKFRVQGLLNYIHGHQLNESNYQAICIKQAIPNMFLSKALEPESFSATDQIPTHKIKQQLLLKFDKIIPRIKNNVDVYNFLHSDKITDIFYKTCLDFYKELTPNNDREILLTFTIELNQAIRRLSKELHDSFARAPFSSNVYDEGQDKIVQRISTILQDSINLVIRDDDNPFVSIYHKHLIMSFYDAKKLM